MVNKLLDAIREMRVGLINAGAPSQRVDEIMAEFVARSFHTVHLSAGVSLERMVEATNLMSERASGAESGLIAAMQLNLAAIIQDVEGAHEEPPRRDILCLECDWIGSPYPEPIECPNCMSPNLEILKAE